MSSHYAGDDPQVPPPLRRRQPPTPAHFRDLARRAVADPRPPMSPVGTHRPPSGLSLEVERSVVDLVLRTAEALTAAGAIVADATAALYRMAAGFGLTTCQVNITFNAIVVSIDRDYDPITRMRIASVRTSDYSRLAALIELSEDAGAGKVALKDAHERLDAIIAAPHPYRRWIVTAALGLMGACVALFLDGGWLVAVVAGATTMIVDRVLRLLRHRGLPYLFQQAAGAVIATSVALALLWAQDAFDWPESLRISPSLIVASGIVVLLAGLSMMNAAEDAISGFPLSAAARGFEVLVSTVGIVVGIAFVLSLARQLGVPLQFTAESPTSRSLGTLVVTGALIAGSWAIASYARPITVILATPAGAVAAVGWALLRDIGFGGPTAAFLAAIVVGFVASTIADYLGGSPVVVGACGVVPLLPGLAIYSALFTLVEEDDLIDGGIGLISALGTGLALAAGVTLGEILARPVRPTTDIWQRRVQRRARGARI